MKLGFVLSTIAASADPFSPTSGGDWQWNSVAGTMCMNGEETGVYVKYSKTGNKNVGVYLSGGGACFNTLTCRTAASDPQPGAPGASGIFDPRSDNPLAGYNWIVVPYCTGDVHAGETESPSNFAVHRNFNGAPNLRLIMARAVDTFSGVDTIFVTGESAGGFGSVSSYVTIRSTFPDARGVLMDDSGPLLDDTALPACLQEKWRTLWALNKNLPTDCPCNNAEGNLVEAWSYAKQRYPSDSFSLISSVEDSVISTFFAFSNNNCKAKLPVGYTKLHDGLERLAETGLPVYMIPGSAHTHTSHDEFFTRRVADVNLSTWIGQLLDQSQADPSAVRPTAEDYFYEQSVNQTVSRRVVV